jgi:hypothetical protein
MAVRDLATWVVAVASKAAAGEVSIALWSIDLSSTGVLPAVSYDIIGSMKTTFDIPEPLLREAQQLAAASGTTTKSIVEQALIRFIAERRSSDPFVLADLSVPGTGLQPEFAGADWRSIRDAVYGAAD